MLVATIAREHSYLGVQCGMSPAAHAPFLIRHTLLMLHAGPVARWAGERHQEEDTREVDTREVDTMVSNVFSTATRSETVRLPATSLACPPPAGCPLPSAVIALSLRRTSPCLRSS